MVDPYGVVCHHGRWYVVGYCRRCMGLRIFRSDRVLAADVLPEAFLRPSDFDCLDHVMRSLAMMPIGWLIEILITGTLEKVRRVVPADLATLDVTPDGVVFRCYAPDLDWVARTLAGLPHPLAIRRPPALRDALRRRAAALLGYAETDV